MLREQKRHKSLAMVLYSCTKITNCS